MITACSPFENGKNGTKAEMRPVTGDYLGLLAGVTGDLHKGRKTGHRNIPRGEQGNLA